MEKRSSNAFKVIRAHTERFRKSAIPSMVKMLNASESKKRKLFNQLDSFVPVNYGPSRLYHCDNDKKNKKIKNKINGLLSTSQSYMKPLFI